MTKSSQASPQRPQPQRWGGSTKNEWIAWACKMEAERDNLKRELAATIERCAGELDRLRQHEFGEDDQFAIGFNEAINQAQFRIRALKQ